MIHPPCPPILDAAAIFPALTGGEITTLSAALLGGMTVLATGVSLAISKIGGALSEVEQKRAEVMEHSIAGQFQSLKEQMAQQVLTLKAARDLIAMQEQRAVDMAVQLSETAKRVEDCNAKGHQARGEFQAEVLKRDLANAVLTEQLKHANEQLSGVNEQLVKANRILADLRDENVRLVQVMTAQAKSAATNAATLSGQTSDLKDLHAARATDALTPAPTVAGAAMVVNTDKPVTVNAPGVAPKPPTSKGGTP